MSSTLIGRPIHSALCHIKAKRFVNYIVDYLMQISNYTYIWFGLVWFYGILIQNPIHTYIWFGWSINHCRLFNAKFSVYIYMGFFLGGGYGISTIVGFIIPNSIYTYICCCFFSFMAYQPLKVTSSQILFIHTYDFLRGGLWHINHCRLHHPKFYLYIYMIFWGSYGISTIVGYIIPNSIYTYILNIHDLSTTFRW